MQLTIITTEGNATGINTNNQKILLVFIIKIKEDKLHLRGYNRRTRNLLRIM